MTTGKIAAVRRLLDTGEVSCAELTRRYLDAIGRDNERLNAYVTVTAETALAAAEAPGSSGTRPAADSVLAFLTASAVACPPAKPAGSLTFWLTL